MRGESENDSAMSLMLIKFERLAKDGNGNEDEASR